MSNTIRVLHVDDDPSFADMTATFLKRESDRIEVQTVETVEECLQTIDRSTVDCVVSDYEMPNGDGLDLLETVRDSYPDIPFILLTGRGSEEVASEAISSGVTDYLQKGGPETYERLATRIEEVVEEYHTKQFEFIARHEPVALLYRISEAFLTLDTDWRFSLINERAEKLFDRPTDELLGESIWEMFPEGADSPFHDHYHAAMAEGEPRTIEEYCEVREQWFRQHLYPSDEGLSIIIHDITTEKERERELHRIERQYRAIFNDPNILVGQLEPDGRVVDINETAMEYVDESLDDIVERPLWETPWFERTEGIRPQVKEWVDRAASGEYVPFEADLERPDGTPYTIEGVFRPVTDESGNVVSIIISDRDVTDRKRREAELARLKERFQAYVEHSSDLITVVDDDGIIQYQSPSIERVLGYEANELVGEEVLSFYHPEDRDRIFEQFTAAISEDDQTIRIRGRFKHAEDRWVWLETVGTARRNDVLEGYVVNSREITERRERELALERHRDNLEQLHEATNRLYAAQTVGECHEITIDAAVSILGFDWCTLSAPAEDDPTMFEIKAVSEDTPVDVGERTFGVDDGIAGHVFQTKEYELVDDAREVEYARPTSDTIRSGLTIPIGQWGIFQAASTEAGAFDDHDRRHAELLVAAMHTAIERIEQQAELELQRDRLDEFTSVVSHDLRSPLSIAMGRLELARDEVESDQLGDIARAHERMDDLIDDLLTLCRQGETVGAVETFPLDEVVESCWQMIETDGATITNDAAITVRADRSRTQQLLENLLRNAIEYGRPDVTVRVGDLDDGFFVEDDGPGIPEEHRTVVFESGYSSSEDGTGFGLSIVKRIVDAHGWSIEIVDGADGGARFEITDVDLVAEATARPV